MKKALCIFLFSGFGAMGGPGGTVQEGWTVEDGKGVEVEWRGREVHGEMEGLQGGSASEFSTLRM